MVSKNFVPEKLFELSALLDKLDGRVHCHTVDFQIMINLVLHDCGVARGGVPLIPNNPLPLGPEQSANCFG